MKASGSWIELLLKFADNYPLIAYGVFIFAVIVVSWFMWMYTSAYRNGRSVKLFKMLEIGSISKADIKPVISSSSPPATATPGHRKIVYVKIIHLRHRIEGVAPVYRFKLAGEDIKDKEVMVYDETVFYVLHMFNEAQKGYRWSVVTTGSAAVPRIIYPWQTIPTYSDPQESNMWEHHNPIADEPSSRVLKNSHFQNLRCGRKSWNRIDALQAIAGRGLTICYPQNEGRKCAVSRKKSFSAPC